VTTEASVRYTYSGIGVYDPELFAGVPRGARCQLAPLLASGIARGRVSGERFGGQWFDIGTPERLAALDRSLRVESSS
jgi:N-acetyl-alpha-D-muramate 1-phosphate uridylyltransferase